MYRRTPESPYQAINHNSRKTYDDALKIIESTVGDCRLKDLTGLDFRRWFSNWRTPKAAGEADRHRRAAKAVQLLRIIVKFGVVANIVECPRLAQVLASMEFSAPPPRRERLTFEQVQAICAEAIRRGRLSIALAQALQFELTLRQIDVIGEWEPHQGASGGILSLNRRWAGGLLWSHINADGVLTKITTKTGAEAVHDTRAYPFLSSILALVPPERRVGPIVVNDNSGRPYRHRKFILLWRSIADAVGVPTNIWNRDSRAGGVTEGSDAGADIEHLRHHATHADLSTTGRYNRRTVEKTRKVAELRVAYRGEKNGA